jgi:hypothetical protein
LIEAWHDYSETELSVSTIERVTVTGDALTADLSDGRTIVALLAWFPRLMHATRRERANWRLIGRGHGIHWPELDEDVSVEGLLVGKPFGESQTSLQKWLEGRNTRPTRRSTRHRTGHEAGRIRKATASPGS